MQHGEVLQVLWHRGLATPMPQLHAMAQHVLQLQAANSKCARVAPAAPEQQAAQQEQQQLLDALAQHVLVLRAASNKRTRDAMEAAGSAGPAAPGRAGATAGDGAPPAQPAHAPGPPAGQHSAAQPAQAAAGDPAHAADCATTYARAADQLCELADKAEATSARLYSDVARMMRQGAAAQTRAGRFAAADAAFGTSAPAHCFFSAADVAVILSAALERFGATAASGSDQRKAEMNAAPFQPDVATLSCALMLQETAPVQQAP
jgi:hypothetical protein